MILPVHEYTVNERTKEAKLLRVRPYRRWVSPAHAPIVYQEGTYMTDGGVELDLSDVPDYIKREVAINPVKPSVSRGEVQLRTCQVCAKAGKDVVLPSDVMEEHLIEHLEGKCFAPKEA